MSIKYLTVENINSYKTARELSSISWKIVEGWDFFEKKTIGDQLVRSIDSIGANIAEGFGRYHKKDKIKFYYNARGSLSEVKHWLELSVERKLIQKETAEVLLEKLNRLPLELNSLIKITNEKLKI